MTEPAPGRRTKPHSTRRIDLIFVDGCPNVEVARANLREALADEIGLPRWREWNLDDPSTPKAFRRFGSPTVLVDGKDVTADPPTAAAACRVDGAPLVDAIRAALRGRFVRGGPGPVKDD